MMKSVVSAVYGMPQWFAVYVIPKHEKCVAEHFRMRGIEHYLPLYTAQRKWKDGSKVTLQLPLFPSYIFAHTSRETRRRVFEAPGVVSIVGKRECSTIPDSDIEFLRHGLSLKNNVELHPYVSTGDRVRVKTGALTGLEGLLVRKKTGVRIVLNVDLIMKSVAVEVDLDEVEPVDSICLPQLVQAANF